MMDWAIRVSHYLDPRSFELQRDVILLFAGGCVVETIVGGEISGGLDGLARQTLDLDDAVALPGFVNCHAHLDLSHLHRQLPRGLKFHEWAPAIIAGRHVDPAIVQAGIGDACRMMAASGTTAVLDISVAGDSAPFLSGQGVRGILALEVLGWSGDEAERAMQRADKIIRARFSLESERLGDDAAGATRPEHLSGVDYGFSPHAPFSTSPELYRQAFGRAFGEGRLCTTHVSETREEQQFMRDGSGPLRELLAGLGVDVSSFHGYGESPITLLLRDWLGPWLGEVNDRLVLVHGNYPQGTDLQWIERAKPTICWCPRSHAFFEHEPWPLREYRAAGANLVLGTDSLASNYGLDMWGEIRAASGSGSLSRSENVPDPLELLRMATINGRRALGILEDAADIAIWARPAGEPAAGLEQLLEQWISGTPTLLASFSQGQLIARSV